jgi:hypothetical protein
MAGTGAIEPIVHGGLSAYSYAKPSNFASPGGVLEGVAKLYRAAPTLRLNHWGLAGVWSVAGEFAMLIEPPGSISLGFHARDLHLVLGPSPQGQPVRFRVKLDGASPGADHGVDVDANGLGRVREPRFYQLQRPGGFSATALDGFARDARSGDRGAPQSGCRASSDLS